MPLTEKELTKREALVEKREEELEEEVGKMFKAKEALSIKETELEQRESDLDDSKEKDVTEKEAREKIQEIKGLIMAHHTDHDIARSRVIYTKHKDLLDKDVEKLATVIYRL